MTGKRATPRSGNYGGVKACSGRHADIVARTEQGGWILGAAVVLMVAVPMLMEAMGL